MVLKSSFISGMIIFRPGAAKKKSDKKITFDFFYTLIGGCFFFGLFFPKPILYLNKFQISFPKS